MEKFVGYVNKGSHHKEPYSTKKHPAHKAYRVWSNMMQRCFNQKADRSERYAARAITVCTRWREFENFYADMGDPPPGLSLDRINNAAGYGPSNCRWATRSEQQKNRDSWAKDNTNRPGYTKSRNGVWYKNAYVKKEKIKLPPDWLDGCDGVEKL